MARFFWVTKSFAKVGNLEAVLHEVRPRMQTKAIFRSFEMQHHFRKKKEAIVYKISCADEKVRVIAKREVLVHITSLLSNKCYRYVNTRHS